MEEQAFVNNLLKSIFEPKGDDLTEEWRKFAHKD
jgi:hypothetical protein